LRQYLKIVWYVRKSIDYGLQQDICIPCRIGVLLIGDETDKEITKDTISKIPIDSIIESYQQGWFYIRDYE